MHTLHDLTSYFAEWEQLFKKKPVVGELRIVPNPRLSLVPALLLTASGLKPEGNLVPALVPMAFGLNFQSTAYVMVILPEVSKDTF